jgi:hypothetical protein
MTIIEMNIQMVLNPISVGKALRYDAQTNVAEVNSVKKYSHHRLMPNIKPGTMMMALVNQDRNSTVL